MLDADIFSLVLITPSLSLFALHSSGLCVCVCGVRFHWSLRVCNGKTGMGAFAFVMDEQV